MAETVYDFTMITSAGEEMPLDTYRGRPMLIVNTATKCGLAPQFEELEELYQDYQERGLVVLGFPSDQFMNQEPVQDEEMVAVCSRDFGVSFPLAKKTKVNGSDAHPLYQHLKLQQKGMLGSEIKWNFTKFLVDADGRVVKRYSPQTAPRKIREDIEPLLTS
ncbi:glutathione peroxidase [Bacillus daqingensis]|uniref:Glutathione peroxidase n=1 Tax=Bacillus daqingensis TaxID=872396 RepID=A0ABV9NTP9_9BACI